MARITEPGGSQFELLAGSRENKLEMPSILSLSKLASSDIRTPGRPHLLRLTKEKYQLRPNIQLSVTTRDISFTPLQYQLGSLITVPILQTTFRSRFVWLTVSDVLIHHDVEAVVVEQSSSRKEEPRDTEEGEYKKESGQELAPQTHPY